MLADSTREGGFPREDEALRQFSTIRHRLGKKGPCYLLFGIAYWRYDRPGRMNKQDTVPACLSAGQKNIATWLISDRLQYMHASG